MSDDDSVSRISCENHADGHDPAASVPLRLVPLRTVLELRAEDAVTDVYITAVPVKSANSVISALRPLLSDDGAVDLQHLRRFVKPGDLPTTLRATFVEACGGAALAPGHLYLMVGPIESITKDNLQRSLSSVLALPENEDAPVWITAVPLLPPTSQIQAAGWSASHWPTIYKKHNPFGPHPSIVSRAELELHAGGLGRTVAMARRVAAEAASSGLGEAIGAAITSRSGATSSIVALAGDARWAGGKEGAAGNVMAHAALRAIGMVAVRLSAAEHDSSSASASSLDHIESRLFLDRPMFAAEQLVFNSAPLPASGYLCHNLEIYLTHEPCVMCSMALLHSRFGKVVFGRRMPQTGGLCSESLSPANAGLGGDKSRGVSGLGHGLFWRKELNWSLLAWEAPDAADKAEAGPQVGDSIQV